MRAAICRIAVDCVDGGKKHTFFHNALQYTFLDGAKIAEELEEGSFNFMYFGQRLELLENTGDDAVEIGPFLECENVVLEDFSSFQERENRKLGIERSGDEMAWGTLLTLEMFSKLSDNMGLVMITSTRFRVIGSIENQVEYSSPSRGGERIFVIVRIGDDGQLSARLYRFQFFE